MKRETKKRFNEMVDRLAHYRPARKKPTNPKSKPRKA